MSNVAPGRATYKPGDTRLGSQTTLNAGSVEDMRRQASTYGSLGLHAWRGYRAEVGDVGRYGRQGQVGQEGEGRGRVLHGGSGGDVFLQDRLVLIRSL